MTGVGFPPTSSNLRDNTMEIAATVFFAGVWLRTLPGSKFGLIVTGGGRGEDLWAEVCFKTRTRTTCPSRKLKDAHLENKLQFEKFC